jgi:hypothetical protein
MTNSYLEEQFEICILYFSQHLASREGDRVPSIGPIINKKKGG